MNLTVKDIERTWVDIPYREVPARNMVRELPHWTIFELCKVRNNVVLCEHKAFIV